MKRLSLAIILLVSITFAIFGAYHTSIPLGHRVYDVIENAEIRGLIDTQMAVRPYSAYTALTLLSQIKESTESISDTERDEVSTLISQIEKSWGTTPSGFEDLLSTGYYRSYDEKTGMGTSLGGTFVTQQSVSLAAKAYDSRSQATAFIKGDLGSNLSYLMNFALAFDHLDPGLFLPVDFTIPGEGFYMRLLTTGDRYLRSIPSDGFHTSLVLSPELGASLFDNNLRIRWGSIKRDWGPGKNNLLLSSTARTFDGIDIQVDFAPWLHYAVVTGSLGKFAIGDVDGKPFFSDDAWNDKPHYRFDNNFSTHRVEVNFTKNLTFGIQESIVWQKRFELSYLNPLTIYMFQQNNLGDIDEMLAGIDLTYTVANKVRLYGAIATTEMNDVGSIKRIFVSPRNMLAYQAGVVVPLPVGSFSSLTAQWTFLSPFFYSHYPIMIKTGQLDKVAGGDSTISDHGRRYSYDGVDKISFVDGDGIEIWSVTVPVGGSKLSPDGRTEIKEENGAYYIYETTSETAYVNKGENIGYPLNPNSQEFLLQVDLGLPKGWTAQAQLKYQLRSGQYGYTVEQYMNYSSSAKYRYPDKEFFKNLFEQTVFIQLSAAKRFENMPIELNAAYRLWATWNRMDETAGEYDGYGATIAGDWGKPTMNHVVQIGAKIYF